jgi:hypothetical protein
MLSINTAAGMEAKDLRHSQAGNRDRAPEDLVNLNRSGSSSTYLMERHMARFKKHFMMGKSYSRSFLVRSKRYLLS